MPELYFHVRWPDGQEEACYSPSLVIADHLAAGQTYPVPEFVARCEQALNEASERVRQKYGFYCSSAMDQLGHIRSRARDFETQPDSRVTVARFEPGAR